MSTRIHTVLGYGFDKVKFKKDNRFNSHVWEEEFYDKDFLPQMVEINNSRIPKDKKKYDFDVNGFRARVEAKGWYEGDKPIKSLSWSDFAKYSGYAGENKSDPLVFTSPFNKDWQRFDNLIDYYIFSNKRGAIDKVKFITGDSDLPCGIYPHINYYNKNTGKKVDCTPYDRWSMDQEASAKRHGFDSVKAWHNDVVPEVPYEIRLFCEAANIFKNPLTVWELRAMMYVYWC